MKRLFSFLAGALLAAAMMAQTEMPLPTLHVEGKWLVDTYGNHVVLHGVMDTPSQYFNNYRWGSPWTDGTNYDANGAKKCVAYFNKLFAGMKQANCDVFRLHLDPAWTNDNSVTYINLADQPEHKTGDLPSGEADVSHFSSKRLATFLKSVYIPLMMDAIKHGLYVVVRPPGVCPGEIRVDGYYQKYLLEVWDMVSKDETIQAYAGQISIELANEPVSVKNASGQSDSKALHDFFQPIADKIRENGFTGIIWVPGSGWQSGYADYKNNPITGYNIGYAVHDYDGWYGCEDKKNSASTVASATKAKITQFHNQVPVVDTNPIIITEIDWSPKNPGSGHYNEHGEWVESNYGTWATGRTSVWGTITKGVHDHYGNISMTLSGTSCLLDVDKLLKTGVAEPAFDGLEEACGKACFDWYAEYAKVDNPVADYVNEAPISDLGDGKYQNPVVRADFPDPDVIRVDNTYYMVSTTMSLFPGATLLKSKDMVNWEYCAQPLQQLTTSDEAYQLKNSKDAYACGMWAPSMKYYNGKFYILINEKRPIDGWNLNGWLLTAANPEGTWTAKKLSRSYYDPGMLFDDDGKIYVAQGIGNISVCEVDANFNCKKEVTVLTGKDGLEGCHFYKKGNYYYIYATYGGWPSGQAVFRSESPFGPYEEKMLVEKWIDGKANTIHQGALIDDVKGKWWTIMQQDLGCLGRFPNLQPVKWVDNWPVVGDNGIPYESYTKPATSETYPLIKRLPTTDNFRSYPLGMQWEWNHTPDNTAWSLFERQGWLRIKTNEVVGCLPQARNMLTQRIFMNPDKATTGTVRLDVSRLQEGDRAGICIFQDPYAAIAVEMKNGQPQLVWWQDKVKDAGSNFTATEKTQAVNLTDNIVYLRAAIKYGDNKAMFYYSTDNKTWKRLGGETSQSFNLSIFFGSRFGLFCYSTKTSGAIADFDWFSTEAAFDEDALYQPLVPSLDEKMFTAKNIVPSKKLIETLIGGWCSPGITATFLDRHKENVSSLTNFEPDSLGIVEFKNGQMGGIGQGSTRVKASYTDLLGNQVDTAFTAKASYFPLEPQFITTNLSGTNTFTRNSTYGLFKFSADGQAGWVYDKAIDLTGYKYLVVQLSRKQTANVHLNIYTTTKLTGSCFSSEEFGDSLTICINLEEAKYTSKTNNGKALNRKSVRMVTFTGTLANKLMYVKDMFLTNDSQYDPTGVTDLVAKPESVTVNVYTLSGQLLRHGVMHQQATQGLPAGIYVIDGKKVIVK
ncbi:MAG: family 43 glycosylhydrolase [Bacteroidaceae bacterium]|nr:family 43 glycosylhydrolase [Bacteroidaceae bacterium]